jgi:hypothetical protein
MLKAAWHWGSDSNVINDPLGEQGDTPLYVGLLSTWGSMNNDLTFFSYFGGRLFLGDSCKHSYKCLMFSWAHIKVPVCTK